MEIDKIKELNSFNITFNTHRTLKFIRSKHDDNYNKVLKIYNEMLEHGIKFNTRICDSFLYWDLDYSLIGATDQTILHILINKDVEFEIIEKVVEEE